MELYKRALILLHKLMENIGAKYWTNYLEMDLQEWDRNRSVKHHLDAYHKEGISDMWICVANGHNVEDILEPWANEIRDNICYIASEIARGIEKDVDFNAELKKIYEAKEELLLNRSFQQPLIASICRKCNYVLFYTRRIEWIVANRLAPKTVFSYIKTNNEEKLLDFKGIYESNNVKKFRNDIINAIKTCNYEVIKDGERMKKCNVCGYEKTGIKYFYVEYGISFARIMPRD